MEEIISQESGFLASQSWKLGDIITETEKIEEKHILEGKSNFLAEF